jgi:DNA topoisomerase I
LKNLIIVESPAKAKTLKGFLGSEFAVVASKGHIRDLPKNSFGIKIADGTFTPEYAVVDDHKTIAAELKKLSKEAETIYLATDEDREGEAIAYHIAKIIGKDETTLPRIVFHEITKTAILKALENPRKLNMDMVNAQQARRLLDRIVGYKLSPLIASKIQKGLSAGRVQSASLKIVVDKEREIRAFVPVEYYDVKAIFDKKIETSLSEAFGKKIDKLSVKTKLEADTIIEAANKEAFAVSKIEKKKKVSASPAPFMTSTLQQAASSQLGFSPKKTMMVAQRLYEGVETHKGTSGVITYMRTDSLNIAAEAQESVRELIGKLYGDNYLPKAAKAYKTKSQGAQEAHEAIRPTMIELTPNDAKRYLKADELRLYTLIYNRFMASQMKDAEFESQNIFVSSKSLVFKASGTKLIFDGFYKVLGSEDKDKLLPDVAANEALKLQKITADQKFTEPPSRYSEAGLVKQLESLGIGRPSTYAPTISTLDDRGYIKIENKQIVPEEVAFKVTDMLEKHFEEIVDSGFTAKMEEELDKVEGEKKDWQKLLAEFYEGFIKKVESGKKTIESQKVIVPIDEDCPQCGAPLVKRAGRFGEFISCSTYPKCKYTRNIKKEGEEDRPKAVETDIDCDKCGSKMVVKASKRGDFLACSAYPKCKNTRSLKEPRVLAVPCPLCGGKVLERNSKRGAFFGCENYPKCTFTSRHELSETKCEACGSATTHKKLKTKEYFECLNAECKHKTEVKA